MRILVDTEIIAAERAFDAFGELEFFNGRELTRRDLLRADALIVRSVTQVNAALLGATPVRFVGSATAGIDHVDVDYLASTGIEFAFAPGSNAQAVAEYVLAAVLLHLDQIDKPMAEASVGIIGYGHVGTAVENLLCRAGMRCVINDPPRERREGKGDYVDLETALAADIVTLHVPLVSVGEFQTINLIAKNELAVLRPHGLLINSARGGVVNEAAWAEHLQRTSVSAAIDCWDNEPDVDSILLRQAFLCTPHIAGHTIEARMGATCMLHDALARFAGATPNWHDDVTPPLRLNETGALNGATPMALVLSCYDPRYNSERLRRMIAFPKPRAGRYFDEVRQQHGLRSGFSRFSIADAGLSFASHQFLAAIGVGTHQ